MRRVQMKERVGSSQMPNVAQLYYCSNTPVVLAPGVAERHKLQVRSSYLHELEIKRVKCKVYLTYYSTQS